MKVCKAIVVESSVYPQNENIPSLRNEDGGNIRRGLKKAGFKPRDKVVIILQEDYERLSKQG
jgi:hypothetical protein